MADRAAVEAFIDGYRRTFETFDVAAIAASFAFPLHVTGEAETVALTVVPDQDHWTPAIARIVGAYRILGVAHAAVRSLTVAEVTARIAQANVHWDLRRADGTAVYDFHSSYTVAATPDGLRITAIAHDEGPRQGRGLGGAPRSRGGLIRRFALPADARHARPPPQSRWPSSRACRSCGHRHPTPGGARSPRRPSRGATS
jgi:hypothetical protein